MPLILSDSDNLPTTYHSIIMISKCSQLTIITVFCAKVKIMPNTKAQNTTICTHHICFNFCRVKLLQIARFTIFAVYDITAHPLPVWSKFLQDETYVDRYCSEVQLQRLKRIQESCIYCTWLGACGALYSITRLHTF